MIYLDNAATSYPKPNEVYEAVMRAMKEFGANPGRSGHQLALQAGRSIFETRELIGQLFKIDNPMNIIFTYNATEGLNLGIKGIVKPGDHVITSSMEHNSVLRPLKALEKTGVETTIIECDAEGFIDIDKIKSQIKDNTKLIVTTHASNLTGTLFPIKEIGALAKEHDIIYMVDAAQSAGIYDLDVTAMAIDVLVFPGHKGLMGPQGTGGIYIREGLEIAHFKEGGTGSKSDLLEQPEFLPDKFESGTPNTPGIAGLGAGIRYILERGIGKIRQHETELTRYFLEELKKIENIKIYGPHDAERRGAVIPINIGDEDSSEVSYILDKVFNIAVRPGLHCAPLAHKTIGTFEQGAVRFSIGAFNTLEDIEEAVMALKRISREI